MKWRHAILANDLTTGFKGHGHERTTACSCYVVPRDLVQHF
jgi:hypothetical protein